MFAKTKNNVTYFKGTGKQDTEKCIYGRISEPINTGKKGEDGKDVYEYESWNVRFVGKAREKVEALADKARITLTEWTARNPYDKEKEKNFPYLMVMDFEVNEPKKEKE